MSSENGIWLLLGAVGVIFVLWLAFQLLVIAAGLTIRFTIFLTIRFTIFAMELPLLLMILMFILFPPTFIVYLVGLFLINRSDTKSAESKVIDVGTSESPALEHKQTEIGTKDGKAS
jgi:hypothetical protein